MSSGRRRDGASFLLYCVSRTVSSRAGAERGAGERPGLQTQSERGVGSRTPRSALCWGSCHFAANTPAQVTKLGVVPHPHIGPWPGLVHAASHAQLGPA